MYGQTHLHQNWFVVDPSVFSGAQRYYDLPMLIDWQIWTAAIVTTTAVRDTLIGAVKKCISDGTFHRLS
jgi:hypothetical protein